MENTPERRQEIYDKIKGSSKQEYILSEMKRLGFWNDEIVDFEAVNKFFKEESELSKKLSKLLRDKKIIEDPEAFIAKKHKERKIASKLKQKETKERREKEREEKAAKWKITKKAAIIYLGKSYSHQLNNKVSSTKNLKQQKLPIIHTALDLANAMEISVGELRFLSFSRKNAKISHYKRFQIPKKSGGYRLISAPMPRLKKAQTWILEEVLNKVNVHEKANGCVVGKSIKTNAIPHINMGVVINQDLKNFFPTITYNRIKGVFSSLGYSDQVATICAMICSEPKILDVSLLGENYYAQQGVRFLPQGSPCSPAITNVICRKLDFRLDGLAKKYNFNYTRYVDDITFSGTQKEFGSITNILKYSRLIVTDENFNLHPEKLRIMKRNNRQEVTGVVVNEKVNINKKDLKKFRALLFQIEKDGIKDKTWNRPGDILAQIDGYANFIYQIDKEKGTKYKKQVAIILAKYNYKEKHKEKYKKIIVKEQEPVNTSFFSKLTSIFGRTKKEATPKLKGFKYKKVDEYTIAFPKYMKKIKNLHPVAKVNYGNAAKEVYTIIIIEDTQNVIRSLKKMKVFKDEKSLALNYKKFQVKSMKKALKYVEHTKLKTTEINGHDAVQYKIIGEIKDMELSYLVTDIVTKKSIYHIMSWTYENKMSNYEDDFMKIANSFR